MMIEHKTEEEEADLVKKIAEKKRLKILRKKQQVCESATHIPYYNIPCARYIIWWVYLYA